ncbi:TBC1 domain family member 20-like [Homarus americanus]|uniref:TBC1 domain family member 20-like n=1 Tax=Homarus americanus TaxID=6706 RepID=UPI001C44C6F7|nr:TBC1 domain family member 20-like [Homarus americanus]XP_042216008.1 TBC1 domain family member 20-like [Homarus americanus]XP_042216096.1 TBC1 domain family member 20-like [Homarus americanus]XP_042216184.1 TBC1 domain family member 20-like [Homarus americanus]
MEQETSNHLENSNVISEMLGDERTDKIDTKLGQVEATKKDVIEAEQFTEPEILNLAVNNVGANTEEDNNSIDSTDKCLGKQKMEQIIVSSSEEETSGTPEKTVKRRKKRPKPKNQVTMDRQKKMQQIQDVLSSTPLDLEALRELAIGDGGLVKDELRRKAWPRLMMIEHMEVTPKPALDVVKAHKDYQQVVLDVKRSLKRFPPGIDDDYRIILMDQLTVLIIRVLMKHPDLNYYQGFHDVAITFLLVMGEDVGFEMVETLSITHLSEFMRPTMEKTTYYLTYLYPILHRANEKLYQFLIDSGVGTVFCLPWLITWFAHTLSDYRNVVRLYDFFLASPYLMPMYIAAAIVLLKKEDVLAGECEMSTQHFILSQVPDSLPFEDILVAARKLYEEYPPDTLQEEVEEYLKKKAEEETLEKQRLIERRKKFDAKKLPYRKLMDAISHYVPFIPVQRQKLIKIVAFAATVFLARSLYNYCSTPAVEFVAN